MRWSQLFLQTLKENPADAEIASHRLLVRAGFIRKLAPGIFTYGTLFLRSLRKLEVLIRDEMDKAGSQEILMPMVHPKELWNETGRWTQMGEGLARFKNRSGHDFCLAATHEEAVTDFVRRELKSYRDLPFSLYQIQTKFRDEIRPRFGLMRGREFVMKDAYSFAASKEGALESYKAMFSAYESLLKRLNLNFRVVEADTGNIGGNLSHEFQLLAEAGEDRLFLSDESEFAANAEVCPAPLNAAEKEMSTSEFLNVEEFETRGLKTIDELSISLKIPSSELVKTLFVKSVDGKGKEEIIVLLLKGDDELNPIKLKLALSLEQEPVFLNEHEVIKLTGAHPGSCGPVGLSAKIYVDQALQGKRNFVVGANKDNFHLRNVNFDRDFKVESFLDIRFAKVGLPSPDGRGFLIEKRGIEVGHIFYLGTKYSKSMGAQFLDQEGRAQYVEMGCYGIGVTRLLQAAVEQSHDKDGIVWPIELAPFQIHICLLDPKVEGAANVAENFYNEMKRNKIDAFIDDREERPGIKFKDADLLGMPLRLNIGARGLERGQIEIVVRSSKEVVNLDQSEAAAWVLNWLHGQSR